MTDITSASRALMEHDQLLEKVFASLAEVVLVQDPATRVIVQCSAAARQVLGSLGDPLSARIFAVVDVWDALTTDRPYREARSRDEALEYIRNEAGKHFRICVNYCWENVG